MKLLTTIEEQDESGYPKGNLDEVCSSLLGDGGPDELFETYKNAVSANEQLKKLESMENTNRAIYRVTMGSLADQFGYPAGSHFTTEGIGAGISKLADKIWLRITKMFKALTRGVKKLLGMKNEPQEIITDRAEGVFPDYKGPLKGLKNLTPSPEFLEDIDSRVEMAVEDKSERRRLLVNPEGGTMWIKPHNSCYQGDALAVLKGEVFTFQSQHGCCEVIGQGVGSITIATSKPEMIDVTEYVDLNKRIDKLMADTVRAMDVVSNMGKEVTGNPPIHPSYTAYVNEYSRAIAQDIKYYATVSKAVKLELRQLAEAELAVIAWEDKLEERT